MIVSHRFKFIFIKTHKTAGSSFEAGVGPLCGPDDIIPPMELKNPEAYARNYYDPSWFGRQYASRAWVRKLVSRRSPWVGQWFWEHMPGSRVRELVPDSVWTGYHKICVERNPWEKVVSYYLWKKHGQGKKLGPFRQYVLQSSHRLPLDGDLYLDSTGKLLVDEVIPFHDLTESLQRLFDRLSIPLAEGLPREKSEKWPDRKPYREYYDDETKARVAELYSREIALFGYQFD